METAASFPRRACAEAKIRTIGAAAGSIIAAIITVHTATNTTAPPTDQPAADIPAMAMPPMPSAAMPPRTTMPIGMLMLRV